MTTNAPTLKKALIDKLIAQTGVGMPLEDVAVAYAWRSDLGHQSIYGGGFRFTHTDEVAEGPGIAVNELVEVTLYISVIAFPKTSVAETDDRARIIGNTIGGLLKVERNLGGVASYLGLRGGQGDYDQDDDMCKSILAYNVLLGSHLSY